MADLVVLDATGSVATSYCAKLFAAFGAQVVNIEPPSTGHPTRHLPPFSDAAATPEASALHAYLSAGKESLVLDLQSPAGIERLLDICGSVDVLLEGFGPSDQGCLDLEALRAANPDLTTISISWYGQQGPLARTPGNDALIASLCGLVSVSGHVEDRPLLPSGFQAQIVAGVTAFVGALGQLVGQQRHGSTESVWLDVSVLECNLCLTEPGAVGAYNSGEIRPRLGTNRFWPTYPAGIYRCKEGWLGVTALLASQWQTFCRLLELPELAAEPRYTVSLERLADADLLDSRIAPALLQRTAEEWFHLGQKGRVPLAMVPTVVELLASEQFQHRRAFLDFEIAGHTFAAPAIPFRLSRTPAREGGAAAKLGAHGPDFVRRAAARHSRSETQRTSPNRPATTAAGRCVDRPSLLEGIRVVDLTMGWAGPLAARHLADAGAEVVKVESCTHFDWWRGWDATEEGIARNVHEKAPAFNMVNRNKLGVTLDLTTERGTDLLKQLVAVSDVVVENFAATVLPKLGLSFETLVAVNPTLIMLSMPPFGADGPWSGYRAYGSTIEHGSGLPHFQGLEGDPPTMQHVALGDPVAGVTGAAALMAALWHRQQTGEGQFLDLSHVESLLPLGIHGILEETVHGRGVPRLGCRHPEHAPHGVYPCSGEESWLTVTITDDEQWRTLAELMAEGGAPVSWPQEKRFTTAADRKRHEDELDKRLAEWTATRSRDLLAARLRRLAIPSAPVLNGGDLLSDTQLTSRGFWQWIDREHVGCQPNPSPPYRATASPPAVDFPAPTLGQHNRDVLQEILGLSDRDIEALAEQGIIGTRPALAES